MERNELIAKLKTISKMHDEILAIQSRMERYRPADEYARSVEVPPFPDEHANAADQAYWKNKVDHIGNNAEDTVSQLYYRAYAPKEPAKPVLSPFRDPGTPNADTMKGKRGCSTFFTVLSVPVLLAALIYGGAMNWILAVLCGAIVAFYYYKKVEAKAEDRKLLEQARSEHNQLEMEANAQYETQKKAFDEELSQFNAELETFMQKYRRWRFTYLAHVDEEKEIAAQLEDERVAEVNRIRTEEYLPACQQLEEYNDLVSESYLPAIDILIDLLMSGRADDLKEAINLYEEIRYRERQLELKRQQEAQRRREEQQRREEEQRRYEEEKRFREEQEYQRQYEERQRQRQEQQRYEEEKRFREQQEEQRRRDERARQVEEERRKSREMREEQERKMKEDRDTRDQCNRCARNSHCSMSYRRPNCASFLPR